MSVDSIDRLETIRRLLQEKGRVRVTALAAQLDVTEVTIRRDLETLVDEGIAQRIHGGAVPIGPQPFSNRFEQHGRAKRVIADKLRMIVPARGNVGIDASTTVQRLVTKLDDTSDVTLVTNGIESFSAAPRRPGLSVILTGGTANEATGSLVGPIAEAGAQHFLLDVFICSAAGIDALHGSSEALLEEASVKRAFAAVAERVVVAVDSAKLDSSASARAFALDAIDVLVTDLDPTDERLDAYRSRVELL